MSILKQSSRENGNGVGGVFQVARRTSFCQRELNSRLSFGGTLRRGQGIDAYLISNGARVGRAWVGRHGRRSAELLGRKDEPPEHDREGRGYAKKGD